MTNTGIDTDTSVMQDRISQLCHQFKLPTMGAQSVDRFTASDHGEALPIFLEVLEQEADDRRHRRINRLRQSSRLPTGKTWETFEHHRMPLALRQQLDHLAQGSFLEHGVNVLAFGLPSRPWPRLRSPKSGPLPAARAWNSSWPSYPTCGGRTQPVPHGSGGCNRPAPGELGQTPSKECGATCCPGCRKTRTPVPWYCWADCKRLNRIVSAGLTCGRCNAECSSGAASWPKRWSTPLPVSPWRNPLQCRN